jgi:hypothetical protein
MRRKVYVINEKDTEEKENFDQDFKTIFQESYPYDTNTLLLFIVDRRSQVQQSASSQSFVFNNSRK